MWFLGKKKAFLLQWQNVVMRDSPNRLIMTEQQLKAASIQQASNDLRIVHDCNKIISETVKPDVFFSRLELLKEKAKHLTQFEPYIKFEGASPSAGYSEIIEKEQEAIYYFIIRYFNAVHEKAESMKTNQGRKNQYRKFNDSLQPYFDRMNQQNVNYIAYKIKGKI